MSIQIASIVGRSLGRAGLRPVAIVSTYPPRVCGIAAFSEDLRNAMVAAGPRAVEIAALDDVVRDFPSEVTHLVRPSVLPDHRDVADWLDARDFQAVILQHEFGIFGGPDGERVLDLVERLDRPLITTMHTVVAHPSPRQRLIVEALLRRSQRVVVLSRTAAERLEALHRADRAKLRIVPHGVPDLQVTEPRLAKRWLGLPIDRPLALSFGLLGPGKGYELAIDAMTAVARRVPGATYVILGSTHPELRRTQGETYRRDLQARAAAAGLSNVVRFVDAFVDRATLGRWLQAADVYVTPYPGVDQIVSGTLAYAVGAGKAIVSTPFDHARELLADGHGTLVPFRDASAMADAIIRYFLDRTARERASRRAWLRGREMIWPAVGAAFQGIVDELQSESTVGDPIAASHDVGSNPSRARQGLADVHATVAGRRDPG